MVIGGRGSECVTVLGLYYSVESKMLKGSFQKICTCDACVHHCKTPTQQARDTATNSEIGEKTGKEKEVGEMRDLRAGVRKISLCLRGPFLYCGFLLRSPTTVICYMWVWRTSKFSAPVPFVLRASFQNLWKAAHGPTGTRNVPEHEEWSADGLDIAAVL